MNKDFVYREIGKNKDKLSRQQLKTLVGQLKTGNIDASYKGLNTILNRISNN